MTREAIVFHYLDNLDAKLASFDSIEAEFEQFSGEATPSGRWSDYKPHLGRRLFFPKRDD